MSSIIRPHSERMRRAQDRRVRALVTHAYQRVPLYRRLWDKAGVHPVMIRGVEDLPLLPVMSRQMLQQAPIEERVARGLDPSKLHSLRTSGSTGEPVTVLLTSPEPPAGVGATRCLA
jgi:phenylacetate-CoA ligase